MRREDREKGEGREDEEGSRNGGGGGGGEIEGRRG